MPERHASPDLKSATVLAKENSIELQDLFAKLQAKGYIYKSANAWELTPAGIKKGGAYRQAPKVGRYIAWPESIVSALEKSNDAKEILVTATTIGKDFNVSANRINAILSELGWIKRDQIKGWHLTELGKRHGGVETHHTTSGIRSFGGLKQYRPTRYSLRTSRKRLGNRPRNRKTYKIQMIKTRMNSETNSPRSIVRKMGIMSGRKPN